MRRVGARVPETSSGTSGQRLDPKTLRVVTLAFVTPADAPRPSLLREITTVPVADLKTHPKNARRGDVDRIGSSLAVNHQFAPLVVQRSTGHVLAGNHTLMAARSLEWPDIDVVYVDVDDDHAVRILLAANRTADVATYDDALLAELLADLPDLDGTGFTGEELAALEAAVADDLAAADEHDVGDVGGSDEGSDEGSDDGHDDGDRPPDADEEGPRPSLADRFLIAPFDVLDARSGWWRTRKRSWLSLGLRSEEGRGSEDAAGTSGAVTIESRSGADPDYYRKKQEAEAREGRALTLTEFEAAHYRPPEGPGNLSTTGTSVFDPVLCELAYRWFCPDGGTVLDPFAGGSVRGLLAAMLGRRYVGNDLSGRQVEANREQAADFAARGLIDPEAVTWSVGDSAAWVDTLEPESADMVFSCPPYLWLERYDRDNSADLSNMDTDGFAAVYGRIVAGAARALRPDRFAVIVVGNVRDRRGRLVDLRAITERAGEAAGLHLHNTAVLVTPSGSLAVRAPRQFSASRTLGRTHQDVVVLYKGDRLRAARACGDVSTALPDDVVAAFDPADPVGERPDLTPDLTPVEAHGGYLVKRDDAWSCRGASGAKSRTMLRLAEGTDGVLTAGARRSPQIERAALVAHALEIACRVHVPAGDDTPEIRTCRDAGAEVVKHPAGRLNVLRARLRDDSSVRPSWFCAPFGMGLDAYAEDVAAQVANVPDAVARIVVPCGSGMTLAGILRGLDRERREVAVLAVTLGHDPDEYLDKFGPGDWRRRVETVPSGVPFDDDAPRTRLGELVLDPMYEAKCLPFLRDGDLLWCVGRRASADAAASP